MHEEQDESGDPALSRRRFLQSASGLVAAAATSALAGNTTPGSAPGDPAVPGPTRDIVALAALDLAEAIRTHGLSCVEVMQAYLAHIDHLNPRFNAIVSLREPDQLLAEARLQDAEIAKGRYRGWMHGLPHAVKDLADAQGFITTHGSPIFRDNLAHADSIHVERIRSAGAIIIGKTNVPEFGLGSHTYNPIFGPTLNAYDGKSTAGGSSGGAAAALALQMLPVADGSDFMGSLRNPGAFNNIIGFRPTPGLVPLGNSFIEELPCNGPMGRNVSDTAMLLSTIAGHHRASPGSLPVDPAQFTRELQRDFKGTRIGWLGDFNGYLPMQDGLMDLCTTALAGFRDIGCSVDALTLDYPMDQLWQTWLTLRHWLTRAKGLPLYQDEHTRTLLKPEMVWEIEGGERVSGDDVAQASAARGLWYAALLQAFSAHDFLVLPTAQVFPFDATLHWPRQIAGRNMDTYHRWMEVVIPGTLSGCPVINVPAGFSRDGLPMGLQLIGRRYADFATLQLAFAYEQATRWNLDKHPGALG